MFGDNFIKVLPSNISSDISYRIIDLTQTGIMCGIGGFSCEGAGTLFTIRETMKDRHKLPKVVFMAFGLITIIYLMFNMSFTFVREKKLFFLILKRLMELKESNR